jgi:hypothetical protein
MTAQQKQGTADFAHDVRPVANIGKRFYTWATLGTFSGASFLVSGIWQTLKGFKAGGFAFTHLGWPLLFSAIVMIAFAFATEPEHLTTVHQKVQKALITVANTLLVFFTVIGGTAILKGVPTTP